VQLSIVTLGHVHAEDITALTPHFTRLEQLVLDIAPRDPLTSHRPELHRAIDGATADWILIVRERETIDDALAHEIIDSITKSNAWGFRIRSLPLYAGKPLRIGNDDGELRLFHRRHFLRHGDMAVQGTVVRLANALRSITFTSNEHHREYLGKNAVPHSSLRRALLFLRYALGARTLDANTLRYLWIEAGFDSGGARR
jgi:hypothetical protein